MKITKEMEEEFLDNCAPGWFKTNNLAKTIAELIPAIVVTSVAGMIIEKMRKIK